MASISLCMIVKNEEDCLDRCLSSVQDVVDEIIIVDTGSEDSTKRIAEKYTDLIYDFTWVHDFSKARNFSFMQASMDYIFWLDADDVVLEADKEKIREMKELGFHGCDALSMHYILAVDENENITSSVTRNRLVKRSRNFAWQGRVHEYLEVSGSLISSDIQVWHKKGEVSLSKRNLNIYEQMMEEGEEMTPRDLYYYANECFDHEMWEKAAERYLEFLNTDSGWVEDRISAHAKLSDCYRLIGKNEEAVQQIHKTFEYDIPRAEQCCRLGYMYLLNSQYEEAIYWYTFASNCELDVVKEKGGFINYPCYTWLPHLNLCFCYDRIEDYEKAAYHNQIAKKFNPLNADVLYNEKYLMEKLESTQNNKSSSILE